MTKMSLRHLESGPGDGTAESLGRREAVCQALQQGQEPLTSDLEETLQGKAFVPCLHPFPRDLDLKPRLALSTGLLTS